MMFTALTWMSVAYASAIPTATGFRSSRRLRSHIDKTCRLATTSRFLLNPGEASGTSPNHAALRGRGIPYVETLSEQKVREIWEKSPFTTVRRVVDAVIQGDKNTQWKKPYHTTFLLKKIPSSCQQLDADSISGYEDLFETLYGSLTGHLASPKEITADPENINRHLAFQGDQKMKHFCLRIAYRGDYFCGWQTQPHNDKKPSVQQSLEDWLNLLYVADANNLDNTPVQKANLRVAGRTDSGVHAVGQISRFRTRRMDLTADVIQQHLSDLPGHLQNSIRVQSVAQVSRSFHPTFTTSCRAYVYIVDTLSGITESDCGFWSEESKRAEKAAYLNAILQQLEGKELDFIGYSYGKLKTETSNCTLHHARAHLVEFAADDDNKKETAICIELVGDRFLRRMVRLLVVSSMRFVVDRFYKADKRNHDSSPVAAELGDDILLKQVLQKDKRVVGLAAPPDGLIFVGARSETV